MGDILFASQSTGGSKLLTHGNRYFQKRFTVVVHFGPPVSLGDKPWTPPPALLAPPPGKNLDA